MEEGLDLNIQDGSKYDKYISYWLYNYVYLNTLGRADRRKQTMSVLFNDETDSPSRLEDAMNYLEPILHNVRLIASGNVNEINWTGDKLPINDIQKYGLSNKRKAKDWLCFPATSPYYGSTPRNNPYLMLMTPYALEQMITDYFSISKEKDITMNRREKLHPATAPNDQHRNVGLNQNILESQKTVNRQFIHHFKYNTLAMYRYHNPNSGMLRYHDSFSRYFTLPAFLDFFKPEVYQGGNLEEVDSENAKKNLNQAKRIVKSMRKVMRQVSNQLKEHEQNIEQLMRDIDWISDGRRLKAQDRQTEEIVEMIYYLDIEMYGILENLRKQMSDIFSRVYKRLGYSEKQIYQRIYKSSDWRLKGQLSNFGYILGMEEEGRFDLYKTRNPRISELVSDIRKGVRNPNIALSYWSKEKFIGLYKNSWRRDLKIEQVFESVASQFTLMMLNQLIPCKTILVDGERTKLTSAPSLYAKTDSYVSLEGLNKYENLRMVGHKYHKVFQGGWETYKKSLKEVKEYDRILITPLIQSKSQTDLGRTIFFIPAGLKPLENNNLHGLKYVRSYYQNDMIRFLFSPRWVKDMQRQLEIIYNKMMYKTKNPFSSKKKLTEREERMMDWSILEIQLQARDNFGFLNW
jgi:hypothetical protein